MNIHHYLAQLRGEVEGNPAVTFRNHQVDPISIYDQHANLQSLAPVRIDQVAGGILDYILANLHNCRKTGNDANYR